MLVTPPSFRQPYGTIDPLGPGRLGLVGAAYSLLLLDRIEAIMEGFIFSASHSPDRSNTLPSGL